MCLVYFIFTKFKTYITVFLYYIHGNVPIFIEIELNTINTFSKIETNIIIECHGITLVFTLFDGVLEQMWSIVFSPFLIGCIRAIRNLNC